MNATGLSKRQMLEASRLRAMERYQTEGAVGTEDEVKLKTVYRDQANAAIRAAEQRNVTPQGDQVTIARNILQLCRLFGDGKKRYDALVLAPGARAGSQLRKDLCGYDVSPETEMGQKAERTPIALPWIAHDQVMTKIAKIESDNSRRHHLVFASEACRVTTDEWLNRLTAPERGEEPYPKGAVNAPTTSQIVMLYDTVAATLREDDFSFGDEIARRYLFDEHQTKGDRIVTNAVKLHEVFTLARGGKIGREVRAGYSSMKKKLGAIGVAIG